MKCTRCGAAVELTMTACAACGAEVELGRLTGILGIVCRACDAYNEPGARTCAACRAPLADPTPAATAAPAPAPPAEQPPAGAKTRVVPIPRRPRPPPEEPALTPSPTGVRGTRVVMRPIAAPAAPVRARLVLEAGAGRAGQAFELRADRVEAGRARSAVAFPDDDRLAPHHATFLFRRGALLVRDEGAPGGVLVRLGAGPVPLRPGDELAVGERRLRYAGPLPPAPAPPPDGTRRLGAPRPASPAIVVEEVLEGGAAGRVFVRGGGTVAIGRRGCALDLGDDPAVSQPHAELRLDAAGNVAVADLGSASGTFLRVPPRGERELRDGDRVRIGREVLRVVVT